MQCTKLQLWPAASYSGGFRFESGKKVETHVNFAPGKNIISCKSGQRDGTSVNNVSFGSGQKTIKLQNHQKSQYFFKDGVIQRAIYYIVCCLINFLERWRVSGEDTASKSGQNAIDAENGRIIHSGVAVGSKPKARGQCEASMDLAQNTEDVKEDVHETLGLVGKTFSETLIEDTSPLMDMEFKKVQRRKRIRKD